MMELEALKRQVLVAKRWLLNASRRDSAIKGRPVVGQRGPERRLLDLR